MGSVPAEKPHAVLVPYPAQGHITPMLQLGKLLHSKGFRITFVNTEYNHRRFIRSHGPDSVKGINDFRFETIPDGLPTSDDDLTQDTSSLFESTNKNCIGPLRQLLTLLNTTMPTVSCIVSDASMIFTLDAAEELGIPNVLLWTASACGFLAYLHRQNLVSRGFLPFKADLVSKEYLETPVDCIPGMSKMRLKDLPSFLRISDPENAIVKFTLSVISRLHRAPAIILNTFDQLEQQVVNELALMLPPIYKVGPLSLLSHQLPPNNPLASLSSSLWMEDTSCLEWLDGKQPQSVVYVNFGSITIMTNEQMVEFAWGLAKSQRDFLWVIRADLVRGEKAVLPEEFLKETKGRGLLASWCNQEAVLSHPSIGVFLTHCGWNSILESICGGVPMICWPFFADQQTNCRYICAEWEIGMEIDINVKSEEVAELIKELMDGEKGKEMRSKILELKEGASKVSQLDGAAFLNLERVIQEKSVVGSLFGFAGFTQMSPSFGERTKEAAIHHVMFSPIPSQRVHPDITLT